ncbi:MAG: hypothetical protein JST00_15305 [Deltaproteobacteria bacterium]|nr:hypothetical protein [Deltaproteobacteria bacterium]
MATLACAACGVLLDIESDPPVSPVEGGATSDAAPGEGGGGGDTSVPDAVADGPAPDAGDAGDASPGCRGAVDCERLVFVTNTLFGANEVVDGDKKCTDEANVASAAPEIKGRTFVAWYSLTLKTAADRHVHGTKPYRLIGGQKVADNWTRLVSGTLDAAINITSSKAVLPGDVRVWTGTAADGGARFSRCNDWQSIDPGVSGVIGSTGFATSAWSDNGVAGCDEVLRLYCIEE